MILPANVSWPKTKKGVEKIITKYVYYVLSVDDSSSVNIKEDYFLNNLEYKEPDNIFFKKDLGELKKRVEFINYFRTAFNRLTTDERKIIYWTYIDKENRFDDSYIANNLGFSLGYYYIKKKETIIRFSYCLGVEKIEK